MTIASAIADLRSEMDHIKHLDKAPSELAERAVAAAGRFERIMRQLVRPQFDEARSALSSALYSANANLASSIIETLRAGWAGKGVYVTSDPEMLHDTKCALAELIKSWAEDIDDMRASLKKLDEARREPA